MEAAYLYRYRFVPFEAASQLSQVHHPDEMVRSRSQDASPGPRESFPDPTYSGKPCRLLDSEWEQRQLSPRDMDVRLPSGHAGMCPGPRACAPATGVCPRAFRSGGCDDMAKLRDVPARLSRSPLGQGFVPAQFAGRPKVDWKPGAPLLR